MVSQVVSAPDPIASRARFRLHEIARWLVLTTAGLWLLHPFFTSRMIGAGDAVWYSHMLADFVQQWRAGVFPVFVGQTDYAFNGAVYPLRVAPLFQHLAGLIDWLSGRQLSFFALQHAVVVVCGLLGLVSSYLCLSSLASTQRWSAVGFSVLYLSCPGVLATIYTQDLYMTWTTVPFLPLAVGGLVRSFQKDDQTAQCLIASGLAALWLGHAPIALWTTLVVVASQGLRLCLLHRRVVSWKRAVLGAGLFVALAHYPFVSVSTLHVAGAPSAAAGGLDKPEQIVVALRSVFPAILHPLSPGAGLLSDLQLGYGLWAVLALALLSTALLRSWALGVVTAASAGLLLLLLPLPGFTEFFWLTLAPGSVQKLTYYWPMHRLYLVIAALLAAAGQLALANWAEKKPRASPWLLIPLLAACGWSFSEARQFIVAGALRTATDEDTLLRERPENRLLMNHAYGLFAKLPAYFSHGVVDPRSEVRLLDRETKAPQPLAPQTPTQTGVLTGELDANPGVLNLNPHFQLKPGQRYALTFDFYAHDYRGILQVIGTSSFREYALPRSGEPLAFGTDANSSKTLDFWTTSNAVEDIALRFIPTGEGAKPSDFSPFATYRLSESDPAKDKLNLTSLLPLKITATTEKAAWLETPRMFAPGYRATIDGHPTQVEASPEGLAMVPLNAGTSHLELRYEGPLRLRLAYWLSLAAWTSLIGYISATRLARICRRH